MEGMRGEGIEGERWERVRERMGDEKVNEKNRNIWYIWFKRSQIKTFLYRFFSTLLSSSVHVQSNLSRTERNGTEERNETKLGSKPKP